MKKLFCVSLLSLAPFLAVAEISDSDSADAVACVGRIVPGARISKLAAPSLGGAQAIVETLNIRKGGFVEKGQIVAVLRGAAKAKAVGVAQTLGISESNVIANTGAWTTNYEVVLVLCSDKAK